MLKHHIILINVDMLIHIYYYIFKETKKYNKVKDLSFILLQVIKLFV